MKQKRLKFIVKYLLICSLLSLCFFWGFFTHQKHVFPYKFLKPFRQKTRTVKQSKSSHLERLRALPYVMGTLDRNRKANGVIVNNSDEISSGYNFYNSRIRHTAYLIDMNGKVVYEWSYPSESWQHSELLPNGDILAIIKDQKLMKIDRDSNLLWSYEDRFHHDLCIIENGDIYLLKRISKPVPEIHTKVNTLDDYVVILSEDGIMKDEFSLLEVIQNSILAFLLPYVRDLNFLPEEELDLLHTNHIEVFDGTLEEKSPLFKKGNILITIRNMNLIAIIDGEKKEIIWAWGPTNLIFPHHSTLIRNGNILMFNNGLEHSEILELDPLLNKVVWRYAPKKGFFSKTRGSNQRLPNGNTLITESDKGYIIEVTPDKKVVWKFANPDVSNINERIAIWRMKRFQTNELPFLFNSPK